MSRRQQPDGTPTDEVLVLQAIKDSLNERGYPPTQREISKICGWSSSSQANNLVKLMHARGLIDYTPGIPRSLRVTDVGAEWITSTNMVAPTEAV